MLEDDIQYLGMKIASSAHAGRPFTPSNPVTGKGRTPRRSIFGHPNERAPSGIVLHVESNGGQPPFELRFLRSLTSAVTIGRKSTSDHKSAPGEPSIAGFTCQVVSGKHAKLAFSDSGFVSFKYRIQCMTYLLIMITGVHHRPRLASWDARSAPWRDRV